MARSAGETFQQALSAMQAGDMAGAARLLKQVLQAQPKSGPALNLLSLVLMTMGRFEEAERYARMALDEDGKSDATLYNYGIILTALKRPAEALEQFSAALAVNASVAETWNNRGTVLNELKRYRDAIGDFDRAISINANYADAYFNKGNALAKLKQHDDAVAAYERALALKPALAEAWIALGNALTELKRSEKAFAAYDKAQALAPRLAAGAWLGRGNLFAGMQRYDDALAAYDRALALKADLAEARLGRGSVLLRLDRHGEAAAAYQQALALSPDLDYAASLRYLAKLMIADWSDLTADSEGLLRTTRECRPTNDPFTMLAVPSSAADQLHCARRHIENQPAVARIWRGERYSHDRIRVAYLSADFRDHAVARLSVGLFEHHDRSRFELTGISFGPGRSSAMRQRIERAFEHFVDVYDSSDEDIAALIRRSEIDIAVDLMGFTQNNRFSVLARRPAPIQVNYLGYPGTMGAPYIDYILADPVVVPAEHFEFYREKVAWLPDSYQVNDDRRRIGERTPSRCECGLPETGFVFCCFNNTFKISPIVFDIWMRLLQAAQSSVLWLLEGNAMSSANLRAEAEKRGISPQRLIFAPRADLAEHLARHRQADLFLDTLPYNAHTTASDALWAGLPAVTCLGSAFCGRVAASLLRAAGLDELITTSLADYEALALRLARDRELLAALKAKLARNRGNCPLFDTDRSRRHIEQAYLTMIDILRRGEGPRHFSVEAS